MPLGQTKKGKKRKNSGRNNHSSKKRNILKYTKGSRLKDRAHTLSETETDEDTDSSQVDESRLDMDLEQHQGTAKDSDIASAGESDRNGNGNQDETQSDMDSLPYRETIGQTMEYGSGDITNFIADNWDQMISRLKQSSF